VQKLLWRTLAVAVLLGAGRVSDAEASSCMYSLVYAGAIHDVPCTGDQVLGRLLSVELLAQVAQADDTLSMTTRPERGHIVFGRSGGSGRSGGTADTIKGFKTANITFVVDGQPISTRGQLLRGVPFVEVTTLQAVLEGLGYNVLVSPQSSLISVFPNPNGRMATSSGSIQNPGAPGLLGTTQQAAAQSLDQLGQGAAGGYSSHTAGAGGGACDAMDTLRSVWAVTEPSRWEKSTMQALATKFQEAKDNGGTLDPADVQNMTKALKSFQKKVAKRTKGTRSWIGTLETSQVKALGNGFLSTVSEVMKLSTEMIAAIEANDQSFVDRAEEDIQRLQELEQLVQQQGTQFNQEVTRVRRTYGCGPATLGLPPS